MISVYLQNNKVSFDNIPKHQLKSLLCYYWDDTDSQINLSTNTSHGKITDVSYILTHDGFVKLGHEWDGNIMTAYESDIHDISVCFQSGEKHHWHREDWFGAGDENQEYDFLDIDYCPNTVCKNCSNVSKFGLASYSMI